MFLLSRKSLIKKSDIVVSGGIVFTATDAQSLGPGFATSGSFTVSTGTASNDRIVIVSLCTDDNVAFDSITIGGTTATLATGNNTASGPNNHGLWYANITSGTSTTVGWSHTSAGVGCIGILVGTVRGQSGGGSATPNHVGFFDTNQAQPIGPMSVSTSVGGVAFISSAGTGSATSSSPTFAFTNVINTAGDKVTGATASNSLAMGLAHVTSSQNVTSQITANGGQNFLGAGFGMLYAAWAP